MIVLVNRRWLLLPTADTLEWRLLFVLALAGLALAFRLQGVALACAVIVGLSVIYFVFACRLAQLDDAFEVRRYGLFGSVRRIPCELKPELAVKSLTRGLVLVCRVSGDEVELARWSGFAVEGRLRRAIGLIQSERQGHS